MLRAEIRRRLAERVVGRLESELSAAVERSLDGIEAGRETPYGSVRKLHERFQGGRT